MLPNSWTGRYDISSEQFSRPDRPLVAIGAILLAVLALSFGDALIKLSSVTFPIWQMFVLRSVIAACVVVALLWRRKHSAPWISVSPWWIALRSLLLSTMWVAYYAALPFTPLSVAASAYYTLPLFIAMFAALFIGERVGGRGWLAIVLGFAGMVVMLKPDTGGFNAYALLPVLAAILYALAMVLTRAKCRNENPLILSMALNIAFILVGGAMTIALHLDSPPASLVAAYPFLLAGWREMGAKEWGVISVLAMIIVVGSTASAYAYQNGPSSVIAIFDYCYLAFAVLWGVLIFAEVPSGTSVLGMFMIAIAGMIAVRRHATSLRK